MKKNKNSYYTIKISLNKFWNKKKYKKIMKKKNKLNEYHYLDLFKNFFSSFFWIFFFWLSEMFSLSISDLIIILETLYLINLCFVLTSKKYNNILPFADWNSNKWSAYDFLIWKVLFSFLVFF